MKTTVLLLASLFAPVLYGAEPVEVLYITHLPGRYHDYKAQMEALIARSDPAAALDVRALSPRAAAPRPADGGPRHKGLVRMPLVAATRSQELAAASQQVASSAPGPVAGFALIVPAVQV